MTADFKYGNLAFGIVFCMLMICVYKAEGQTPVRITLQRSNTTVRELLSLVEKQTDYTVAYDHTKINVEKSVSVNISNAALSSAMDAILKNIDAQYRIHDSHIFITPKPRTETWKAPRTKPLAQNFPQYFIEPGIDVQDLRKAEVVPVHKPAAYVLALRTNLLFDLALAPNIGLEVFFKDNFSVAADFAYAYWRISNTYALQTIQGDLEGRYWFATGGKPLTGWNAGIYTMYCSRFDVQWKEGYQGNGFWSAGIVAGYSIPVSRKINLDFSLGGGYWYSPEVRHYSQSSDGHLIWEETRYNVGRISLTKARVNLVWVLGDKNNR